MKYITLVFFYLTLMVSCNQTDHDHDAEAQEVDTHDHGSLGILVFEKNMELFAETDQLFVGHEVEIRAHLTFLEDYSPAKNGILHVRIIQDGNNPEWVELKLAQAGIFTGSVSPENPGMCSFEFRYTKGETQVVFSKDSLKVYTHDDVLPDEAHHHELTFTKEQAWKTEFGLMPVKAKDFISTIHCSGEIFVAPESTVELIAPAGGKIAFAGTNLLEGTYVRKGSQLFTILGTGLGSDNILMELNTAKAEYEKSSADLVRKEKLMKIEAVSKKEYEASKANYETNKTRYQILKNQINESGIIVKSPVSGYITEVLVASNSYAEAGAVLVKIIKKGGLLIKANVPVTQADKIKMISSANFKLPHDKTVYSLNNWDGRVSSFGKTVDPETGMIPVYFAVDKPDLVPGTFAELWLLTDTISNQVVVPESSLLEEYGLYYVFVQEEGEAYEKRLVHISDNDGKNYLLSSGLSLGEVIVSKGAMAIKVANAMGGAPVHTH